MENIEEQIISVVGLRRTGKTTLMYQLIDHLIKNGVPPKNILYFSFDEILGAEPKILEEIIENYQKMILKTEEKTYVFLEKKKKMEKTITRLLPHCREYPDTYQRLPRFLAELLLLIFSRLQP